VTTTLAYATTTKVGRYLLIACACTLLKCMLCSSI